jgi:hypothetical protein
MLTDTEITIVEATFLAIDGDSVPHDICQWLVDKIIQKSNGGYEYLLWLVNRWVLLRSDRRHLPKRFRRWL